MDKKQYFAILACVLALCIVLVLVGQYGLMIAILAVMFLLYVVGTVPPVTVMHAFTTVGLETAGQQYFWKDMKDYWFSVKDDQTILNVDVNLRSTGRVMMLVSMKDAQTVHSLLSDRLVYKDMRRQGRVSEIIYGIWVDLFDGKSLLDQVNDAISQLQIRKSTVRHTARVKRSGTRKATAKK